MEQKETIYEIAKILDLNGHNLERDYKNQLRLFIEWYISAKKLISKHKKLKEIYVTCWYMPEAMGICAAASQLGIKTIDIQHGKQGKYQAMYSGWTKIPDKGYDLMPDNFWCWGQPSCDHILSSSPNRNIHTPFIGGYPWVNYYKKNLMKADPHVPKNKIKVLVTMQPPQGQNIQRIPDFIIDFLKSNNLVDIHFIFRLHPNDNEGYYYCKNRLRLINPSLYTIEDSKRILYDIFLEISHHITAFSSCGYEASLFNIPTLLYGDESKEIYKYEIKKNIFAWTDSSTSDLLSWLTSRSSNGSKILNPYIEDTKDKMR